MICEIGPGCFISIGKPPESWYWHIFISSSFCFFGGVGGGCIWIASFSFCGNLIFLFVLFLLLHVYQNKANLKYLSV